MKKIILLFTLICGFGFQTLAATLNLDDYLADEATYLYEGKPYANETRKGSIKKEEVYVKPLDQTMTRYMFRSLDLPESPDMVFFTIYQDTEGNYYSYMSDIAYMPPASDSFTSEPTLNPNKWVKLQETGRKLSGVFYPNDLGEQQFTFEFSYKSITITITEWEQWFGMIPIKKTSTSEFLL